MIKYFLDKLLNPKLLIVIAVLICLIYVTLNGAISSEALVGIISLPIGFYFGSSYTENKKVDDMKNRKDK